MRLSPCVLAACLVLPIIGPVVAPALAQNTDVIAERQQLMKNNAREAKAASGMIKGDEPFDAAKAAEVFQVMNADARKFGTLFPEDSKTGGDTKASPAIWERKAEFEAANAKFVSDTQAAIDAKPADVEAFKTAFSMVSSNCQSCHQQFRSR